MKKHDMNMFFLPKQLNTKCFSNRLDVCKNLYKRDLVGHYGCVNAVNFSNDGDLLVSGGDDQRVLLWNCNEITYMGEPKPIIMKERHMSNIYCTAFDCNKLNILSAGNDEKVLRHDIESRECTDVFPFVEPVYAVDPSPESSAIFLAAGEDGTLKLCDARAKKSYTTLAFSGGSFHGVTFNPTDSRLIVSANSLSGIALQDVRFPKRVLLKYHSKFKNAMSVKFDFTGTRILGLMRRSGPILYKIDDISPIMQFSDSGYQNVCTMKTACFAGRKEEYVIAGSDNFDVFIWKISSKENKVHLTLHGHRSVVNQVRYNQYNNLIVSAGVEKVIKIWSPFKNNCWRGDTTGDERFVKRRMYTNQEYLRFLSESGEMTHNYDAQKTDEDPKMLALFDSLIKRISEDSFSDSDNDELPSSDVNSANNSESSILSLRRIFGSSSE
ncbi:DDB1- and CUL4-associated factor 5-like isoform X1 [Hydractinia symbiolongicarpus]|uniref:DDB1- and CUL4-associated factor 5-like isoform X1 n=1 Tax=Hydractinia symbiolongicarpus TaxID=13093 RepID=UPI00254B2649|nr:DDB1- and CUL4-associated factor 5-like isoform X1 [Hydractinia symbiolongicarpus]